MEQSELAELYVRYGYAVHRRCLRLLGSEAEADDAVQEIFMRVQRYGGDLRSEAPLPWLCRIADRHCFDVLANRRRWAGEEETTRVMSKLAEARAPTDDERVRVVAEVLATMKPRVREVAVLYYVDELTQEEVAEATGYSRKTVKEKLAEFLAGARKLLSISPAEKTGRGTARESGTASSAPKDAPSPVRPSEVEP